MNPRRLFTVLAAMTALLALVTGVAVAHVERSSYWPNPAPDRSVKPAAGGKVPKARGLASALNRRAPRRHLRGLQVELAPQGDPLDPQRAQEGLEGAADGAHAEALEEGRAAAARA